jgi:tryptophan-rich sensory protein
MNTVLAYIISITFVATTSFLGSYFTNKNSRSPWYDCIKPSITPPPIVFPIVWTTLYVLIAIAFALALAMNDSITSTLFMLNLFLNVLWCYFFFYSKAITLALVVILFLVTSIVTIMVTAQRKSIVFLLIPYLLWVMFATVLNGLTLAKEKECR